MYKGFWALYDIWLISCQIYQLIPALWLAWHWTGHLLLETASWEVFPDGKGHLLQDTCLMPDRYKEGWTDMGHLQCICIWCRCHVWSGRNLADLPIGGFHVQEVYWCPMSLPSVQTRDTCNIEALLKWEGVPYPCGYGSQSLRIL